MEYSEELEVLKKEIKKIEYVYFKPIVGELKQHPIGVDYIMIEISKTNRPYYMFSFIKNREDDWVFRISKYKNGVDILNILYPHEIILQQNENNISDDVQRFVYSVDFLDVEKTLAINGFVIKNGSLVKTDKVSINCI